MHGTYLGEVELQRVVCAQTDVQPNLEEVWERVSLVSQEECVVTERAHGQADLLQVEKVLESRDLAKEDTMGDRMSEQIGRGQVVRVPGFATMWAEDERILGHQS